MDKAKEDKAKRRKVGTACIYCRRSHMTCDEGRPCKRCIKRDIGHLCHDESTSKTPQSQKVDRRSSQISNSSTSPARASSSIPNPSTVAATTNSSTTTTAPSAFIGRNEGPSAMLHAGRVSNSPNLTSITYDTPTKANFNNMNWGTSVLGGAGFLGLGGGGISGMDGDMTASGDAAGGNEFNILSEFLESLDGSAVPTPGVAGGSQFANNGSTNFDATIQSSLLRPTNQNLSITNAASDGNMAEGAGGGSSWSNNQVEGGSGWQSSSNALVSTTLSGSNKNSRRASLLSDAPMTASSSSMGGGLSSKTEKFFLTAADQKDGTRDERLGKVIQAKYDAGLLRPYNHVNGYARLNRWMEQNASQASRRRILKPLSIFRPAFRAVAQSLTNVDLIFIEEAFERLLLDYDRVFSTQGIPACLWRRTGEIYKGNKEFAELVGVGIEALRDGRCTIYELMQEESAVNYWEKYGAVSFDPGQKAVLTSCVLKTKNSIAAKKGGSVVNKVGVNGDGGEVKGQEGVVSNTSSSSNNEEGFVSCCFSFTIRRDAWSIPCLIVGNFLPLQ